MDFDRVFVALDGMNDAMRIGRKSNSRLGAREQLCQFLIGSQRVSFLDVLFFRMIARGWGSFKHR